MIDTKKKYATAVSYKIDAKEADYLYIKKSRIPMAGMGLYAGITIYKDEVIALFKGEILSKTEAKKRVSQQRHHYFINLPDGKILDSMNVKCFAKYANDTRGFVKSDLKNNCIISLDEMDRVCLIAKRDIKKGEEVFCSYGKAYWKERNY